MKVKIDNYNLIMSLLRVKKYYNFSGRCQKRSTKGFELLPLSIAISDPSLNEPPIFCQAKAPRSFVSSLFLRYAIRFQPPFTLVERAVVRIERFEPIGPGNSVPCARHILPSCTVFITLFRARRRNKDGNI